MTVAEDVEADVLMLQFYMMEREEGMNGWIWSRKARCLW